MKKEYVQKIFAKKIRLNDFSKTLVMKIEPIMKDKHHAGDSLGESSYDQSTFIHFLPAIRIASFSNLTFPSLLSVYLLAARVTAFNISTFLLFVWFVSIF